MTVGERVHAYFDPRTRGSSWRVEALAGLTTFMTMAYIIVVNASILGDRLLPESARMAHRQAVLATCLAAALGTLLMGFLADYPIALAPGMGLNAFFAYEIAAAKGGSWQIALGVVFLAGLLFFLLTMLGVRKSLMRAVPACLKYGFACGIGIFIAFIGLEKAGISVRPVGPGPPVALGELTANSGAPLVVIGLAVLTGALLARKVRGALLIGIGLAAVYAVSLGKVKYVGFAAVPEVSGTFLAMDLAGAFRVEWLAAIFILLFFDVFDTMGTLIGVGELGGFVKDGQLPRAQRALLADSLGTLGGAVLGTSTVTSYIESASGVAEGGRTGLANLFTAGLFVLAAFLAPLVEPFARVGWVASPALIAIGVFMLRTVKKIDMEDVTEALPAFAAMVVMPFTFSIANGLVAGFVCYSGVKLLSGRGREVHPWIYTLSAILAVGYVFLKVFPQAG
ncbi:MAG: NCS2 family permease [Planctomycetota bacterium]|jgi:AGZA family xanthine/uracil permease-like MFS transporter